MQVEHSSKMSWLLNCCTCYAVSVNSARKNITPLRGVENASDLPSYAKAVEHKLWCAEFRIAFHITQPICAELLVDRTHPTFHQYAVEQEDFLELSLKFEQSMLPPVCSMGIEIHAA